VTDSETHDPTDSDLARWVPRFAGRTVLVLGDLMLDRYVFGEVRRISPEAPIPVLRAERRRSVPGGAANVAHNIASLGARAVLVGLIGRDEAGLGGQAARIEGHSHRLAANRWQTAETPLPSSMAGAHSVAAW
jgi:bifunctional ADP-heptose synthase (sugar kinase/adenylyltransferase)